MSSAKRQALVLSVLAWLAVCGIGQSNTVGTSCRNTLAVEKLQNYARMLTTTEHAVEGWVAPIHFQVVFNISQLQLDNCINGSVGEIGVHHGRFFIGIYLSSEAAETKVALDLFRKQRLNVDGSGQGDLAIFKGHLVRLGLLTPQLQIIEGSSLAMSDSHFRARGIPKFRLLSVDGAHHYAAVVSDLRLAAAVLAPGGIAIVDDFVNSAWLGVVEGTLDYIKTGRLVPFLWLCNKLYLSSPEYYAFYYSHVMELAQLTCATGGHSSRTSLRGWQVCVAHADCMAQPFQQVQA